MLRTAKVGAVAFWAFTLIGLLDTAMQGQGRVIASAVLAGTFTVIAVMCRLEDEREARTVDRLRLVTDEYRRREAALIKTAGLLADAPTTGPLPRLYPVAQAGRR
jgi:hypothetical protein